MLKGSGRWALGAGRWALGFGSWGLGLEVPSATLAFGKTEKRRRDTEQRRRDLSDQWSGRGQGHRALIGFSGWVRWCFGIGRALGYWR